ncbi:MAG: SMC-Scp complex subunit ScpB [Planctomycetia bacterium]|nr:SMC-Scp complex subunit ScpB [Planctomycetia bacterium]
MRKKTSGWRHSKSPLVVRNRNRNGLQSIFHNGFLNNLSWQKIRKCHHYSFSSASTLGRHEVRNSSTESESENTVTRENIPSYNLEETPTRTDLARNVEALLFLTREPLSIKRLAQLLSWENTDEILDIIRQLNLIYDANHCAFRILEFARGFQLRVRPQFTPWLRQLCHQVGIENQENPEIRLSPPAMETLAIIAYREAFNTPATRAEIEAIRGVQSCMEILKQLLGKDLIRIAGRSTELGRPRLYRTTKKFLEVFGLKSLLQLPRVDLS